MHNRAILSHGFHFPSLNPYFYGSRIKAREKNMKNGKRCGFNPYFYGSRIKALGLPLQPYWYQHCFNPYFYGSRIKALTSIQYSCGFSSVSILIFMDRALKLDADKTGNTGFTCFNPYFYGSRIKAF